MAVATVVAGEAMEAVAAARAAKTVVAEAAWVLLLAHQVDTMEVGARAAKAVATVAAMAAALEA